MKLNVTREQVLAAFDKVKHDESFAESRRIVEQGGMPVEMLQAMSIHPDLLGAFMHLGVVYPGGLLERPLKEKVILESSRRNSCQFCTNSHIAIMRQLGIAADPLLSLDDEVSLTKREHLALEYTRAAMADSNRVPDALFAQLKESFSDAEIVELTFLIGFINMLNLFNNCLQVTYRGNYGE